MSTLDDYLQLLANEQRRRILRTLLDSETSVVVEADDPAVEARLYHVHLPRLADAGVVDWDPRNGTVVRGPAFDDIAPVLEAIDAVTDEDERLGTDGDEDGN